MFEWTAANAHLMAVRSYSLMLPYLASQMFEETIKLKTKLDKETQKRLKSRIKHLTETYSDDASPSAQA